MQGPGLVRRSSRGSRAAGRVAILGSVAAIGVAATAQAHVSSRVENGHLIARSDGAADIVKVSCGSDLRVKVNGLDPNAGAAPCASIRRVRVLAGGGPDTINVSRVGPRNGFSNKGLRSLYSVQVFGGASSDRISGSRLSDLLAGGVGHDVLRGRAGSDLLRGGPGSDLLRGGRGPDVLIGGHGRDRLVGGAGKDVER
jgi:RTX calcium-binding nonapeptide repeat (4 copies)